MKRYMTNSLIFKILLIKSSGSISLFVILVNICFFTSCTVNDPEMAVEPNTLVYLVTINNGPNLHSLTIVDSLDGTGSMEVPNIAAHPSSSFDLVIDRIDQNRANISASQTNLIEIINVTGAGFFTNDSVYVEFNIDGFNNRDILSGSR